ncbi:formate dehydrogenase accessory sulfurtransferase FdhD [Candidatus Bathyarchaeota archaeon]|nr:formate dehydrogenase accessory sulfurtransferase FdhD [Candidatus Bathyarchaeota archaeon]
MKNLKAKKNSIEIRHKGFSCTFLGFLIVINVGNFMLSPTVEVEVKKIDLLRNMAKKVKEHVATEVPVNIYVNNKKVATLFSLPTKLKELGVGWILSQAIVKSINEVIDVKLEENNVRITCKGEVEPRIKAAKTLTVIDSSTEDFLFLIDRIAKPFVSSNYKVDAREILRFAKVLNQKSSLFRLTGGVHSAALFQNGSLVAFAEDVGRHNAVDKVIGIAALKKVDFSRCVLLSSGRQPANMVLKAARVGVPIVASIAGPVYSGIEAALKTGVTLVCFVRGERLNVYSFPERVLVA